MNEMRKEKIMDRFKCGEEIKRKGGYILYKVHYDDGKLHPHVHERISNTKESAFKQKLNMLLHERFVEEGLLDWYAGTGSSEEAQLIWNTKEIPVKVIGRNFAFGERVAKGTPFSTMLLEYKMEGKEPVDYSIIEESGIVDVDTMEQIEKLAYIINDAARRFWAEFGIVLAGFELSFGLDDWNQVRLTSEFSEANCTLWNKSGNEVQNAVFGMDLNVEEVANIYEKIK